MTILSMLDRQAPREGRNPFLSAVQRAALSVIAISTLVLDYTERIDK